MMEDAKTIPNQKIDESKRIHIVKLWPYRLIGNILILTAIAISSLGILIFKSNYVGQKLSSLSDYFYTATSYLGFTIDDILVYGRNKTSLEEVNNIVNARYGDNILNINIHQLKKDIEQLPWIKKVTIQRSYFPNILQINIAERKIQSLWQINNHFYPIDTDGYVIHSEYIPSQPMLLIIGQGAPEHINELLDAIKQDDNLFKRIKVANYISGRRWNIIIDDIENGITIKLPQDNIEEAWKKLIKLNKTQGLLKRKLTIIDLRFDGKVLVRPKKMSTEEKLIIKKGSKTNI